MASSPLDTLPVLPAPDVTTVAVAAAAVILALSLWSLYNHFFLAPQRVLRQLQAQGIPGYPFRPFVGQLLDIMRVRKTRDSDPAYAASTHGGQWFHTATEQFGNIWTFALGPSIRVVIADPSLVRQAYIANHSAFPKSIFLRKMAVLGDGLLSANGDSWSRQRRLINPAFNHRELKRIFPTMVQCTDEALARLAVEIKTKSNREPVEMGEFFSRLTLDIICRSAFGSQLEDFFGDDMLEQFMESFSKYLQFAPRSIQLSAVFPLYQYLPVEINREVWKAEKVMSGTMKNIISVRLAKHKKRVASQRDSCLFKEGSPKEGSPKEGSPKEGSPKEGSCKEGEDRTDLLELMMGATEGMGGENIATNNNGFHSNVEENQHSSQDSRAKAGGRGHSQTLTEDLLMANCITFLLAGHETTGNLLTWTSLLLSQHPEWQEAAREEVNALYNANGGKVPTFDQLSDLKKVGWILNESMRLYPAASVMGRVCSETTKLSDSLTVPSGCDILIPIGIIHRSKELWGEDADCFRPERFANGIGKASKHPHAFMPFSLGPRTCIGQAFALNEAKIVVALILTRFKWTLAETYVHHPDITVTLRAKHGMPLYLTPLR